jgi:hypothetical protein
MTIFISQVKKIHTVVFAEYVFILNIIPHWLIAKLLNNILEKNNFRRFMLPTHRPPTFYANDSSSFPIMLKSIRGSDSELHITSTLVQWFTCTTRCAIIVFMETVLWTRGHKWPQGGARRQFIAWENITFGFHSEYKFPSGATLRSLMTNNL